jgi:hypothetical protein
MQHKSMGDDNGPHIDPFDADRPCFWRGFNSLHRIGGQLFGAEKSLFRLLPEKPGGHAEMLFRLRGLFAGMPLHRLLGEQDRRQAMRFFQKLMAKS